jgi:hypothetical protein
MSFLLSRQVKIEIQVKLPHARTVIYTTIDFEKTQGKDYVIREYKNL